MKTSKLRCVWSLAAVTTVALLASNVMSQQIGIPPTRIVPGQPNVQPPPTRVIEGQPRVIEGQPRLIEPQPGGDAQEPPLPDPQRQVSPRTDSGTSGVESRAGGRGGGSSRQTIRVAPRPRVVPQGRWRLGIYFDDSPRGLRIRQVLRPSAASRFGLEEGDYLLDIMGYPLGVYGNNYYSLDGVMNRLTPPDGWVNILVWNKRTLAEEAMWVQLERRGGTVPTPRPYESER